MYASVRACMRAHMYTDDDRTKSTTDAPPPATPTLLKLPRPRTMSPDTTAALIRPATKRILAKPMIRERKRPRAVWTLWKRGRMPVSSKRKQKPRCFLSLRSSVLNAFNSDLDLILLWDRYCEHSNIVHCELSVTMRIPFGFRKKVPLQ